MGSNIQSALEKRELLSDQVRRAENSRRIGFATERKVSPIVWLSVSCLDAPTVAVTWQWLFARTLHSHITASDRLVLFLTAWIIYLADRMADSFTIPSHAPISKRQRFCLGHRDFMITNMALIAIADAVCMIRGLERETVLFGALVATAIGLYLAINHLAPVIWGKVPLKEMSIGFLFALGAVAAIAERNFSLATMTFFFGMLCALNCLSISVWERPLDLAQRRVSFATAQPALLRIPEFASWILAFGAFSLALNPTLRWFALCIAISAVWIAILNRAVSVGRDERVALADLVLLSPLLLCSGAP